jgi:hypothetical protein
LGVNVQRLCEVKTRVVRQCGRKIGEGSAKSKAGHLRKLKQENSPIEIHMRYENSLEIIYGVSFSSLPSLLVVPEDGILHRNLKMGRLFLNSEGPWVELSVQRCDILTGTSIPMGLRVRHLCDKRDSGGAHADFLNISKEASMGALE